MDETKDKDLKELCSFYEKYPKAGTVPIDEEVLWHNRGKQVAVCIKGLSPKHEKYKTDQKNKNI